MEQTKKRKEKDGDDRGGGGRRKKTAPQTMKDIDKEEAAATEEEVEEFYAIVRRMQAAVKYFEKDSGKNINSVGDQVQWRAALEATLPAVADADVDHVKSATSDDDHEVVVITELGADNNVVLDLNEAPVEEDRGD